MKVDVVYPLSNYSKNREDLELRYSLRSLAQQSWVRRIILVGHKPSWVKDVVHIPFEDQHRPKDANIISKILAACQYPDITSSFVVNSDDQYILKPIELDSMGPWLEDPCPLIGALIKQQVSVWYQRLQNTVKYCGTYGFPQWVFQCHIPYLVDRDLYIETMGKIPYFRGVGLLTHVYFNMTLCAVPAKETPGMVVRVKQPVKSMEFGESLFLNHNDDGLCNAVKKALASRFPQPSPWEV